VPSRPGIFLSIDADVVVGASGNRLPAFSVAEEAGNVSRRQRPEPVALDPVLVDLLRRQRLPIDGANALEGEAAFRQDRRHPRQPLRTAVKIDQQYSHAVPTGTVPERPDRHCIRTQLTTSVARTLMPSKTATTGTFLEQGSNLASPDRSRLANFGRVNRKRTRIKYANAVGSSRGITPYGAPVGGQVEETSLTAAWMSIVPRSPARGSIHDRNRWSRRWLGPPL
jgi:hypothetical protein